MPAEADMISLHLSLAALAGLGPAHVVVLFNADVPEATGVAEAYAAARQLPDGHLCPVTGVDPEVDQIDFATFDNTIRAPLDACLAALPQPEEIDAIVTVRGLPYVVTLPTFVVGLEAALQVGRGLGPDGEIAGSPQADPGGTPQASVTNPAYLPESPCDPADLAVDNPYGSWYRTACALLDLERLPRAHRRARNHVAGPYDLSDELYVVGRLDGFDYDDAHALIDRALLADGAFPTGRWLCMEGGDEARAARDPECELATRMLADAGEDAVYVSPHDPALAGHEVLGYLTGAADLRGAIDGLTYAPGALACNLTSFGAVPANFRCDGGMCPGAESQTSVARFVRAGATAVHGTVAEPLNNSFPDAGMLLLYQAGYSVGEAVLFSQQFLYWQNLLLGDPLTTPFAERPEVVVPPEVVAGEPVVITASHPDGVAEVRLYAGGVRVADAESDTLEWDPAAAPGDVLDLMAVAIADKGAVGEQTVRAETQGWWVGPVTVLEAGAEPDEAAAEPGGCGCRTVSSDFGTLLARIALRRR